MIRVTELTKSFGDVEALRGIDFEIGRGEVVGFLGPNGAGKTTAMRIITGFLAADSGQVTVAGHDVLEETLAAQRHIGYLPENNPLYREMLVSDFLQLAAELKHIPRAERRAALDFAVTGVGIEDVFHRPVGTLSKGYRQRVGIAAALLHRPDVLLLDEPSEGLDPNQRTEIRSLLSDLAREHTVVMSTHVMQEAQAVCDRLVVIAGGQVVADGATRELARSTAGTQVVLFEAEGREVRRRVQKLDEVDEVDVDDAASGRGRLRARIIAAGDAPLQPALSRLAREHEWTIWTLHEEQRGLEDVFQELTMGDGE